MYMWRMHIYVNICINSLLSFTNQMTSTMKIWMCFLFPLKYIRKSANAEPILPTWGNNDYS